jgi:predicted O-methyltransferase YrrM
MNLKDIRTSTLDRYFTSEDDFISIPENDHLMGFNIGRQTSVDLLGDWRGSYMSGEYKNFREWGSSFILSRFVTIYNAHGMFLREVEELGELVMNLKNRDMQAARDSSGQRIMPLSDSETSPDILPNRYKQLADLIRFYKPKTILETGTWNGGRAIEMALASFDHNDEVHYIGYDLFEDATTQTDKEEFNAKPHNTKLAVVKRLDEFKEHMKEERQKEFSYELYKGNVRDTLDGMYTDEVDFALIGSGNSEQTVQHEYSILKHVPIVVGDHFFTKDDDKKIPPEEYQGIKKIFDKVATKKVDAQKTTEDGWTNFDEEATTRKYVLPSSDRVAGGGHTHLVVFLHDANLEELPEELKRVPIVVHPRDCVPKDYIKNNIQTNINLIDPKKWVSKHPPHKRKGIIVSAGPYLDYKKLKDFIKKNPP